MWYLGSCSGKHNDLTLDALVNSSQPHPRKIPA